jgi:exosortase/archaeosortase family protein
VDGLTIEPPMISYKDAVIRIIFACTAVQSMVLFVGMILPLPKVPWKRKITGVLITVLPVYLLNLVRNASIVYLVGIYGPSFFGIAHNYIGKAGSLIALVILLFIVAKILPEIFDDILGLFDLPKRNGPLEVWFRNQVLGKK